MVRKNSPNRLIVLKFSLNSSNIKRYHQPAAQSLWSTPMSALITLQIQMNATVFEEILIKTQLQPVVKVSSGTLWAALTSRGKKMQTKRCNILRPFRQEAARSHLLVLSGLLEFSWCEQITDVRSGAFSMGLSVCHGDSLLMFSVLGVVSSGLSNLVLSSPQREQRQRGSSDEC